MELSEKNKLSEHVIIKDFLRILFLTLIIFLLSFPKLTPVIETGLHGSANYAFNYFFANGIQAGVDVVFTYGPLGFLKSPLLIGNNLIYGIIFMSIMRLLFIFLFFCLGNIVNSGRKLLNFVVALGISLLITFDMSLIGIIIISLIICRENKQHGIWFFVALIFTVLGMLIKASIGFSALLIMFSYLMLTFFNNKSLKPALISIAGIVILFLIFRIVIYGNFHGILNYFSGTYQLIKGNSSAVALHPYNNWFIIISCILIFFYLPFSINSKRIFFLYCLLFLSVFALWKYSFSREENFHLKSLLNYIIMIFAIILVYSKNIRTIHLVLMGVCLMLYYRNMELTEEYKIDDRVNFIGINNFISATTGYEEWTESCNNQSQRNILPNKLEHDLSKYIGDRTIDIYPWDYSYVAANGFNWIPRPLIQSYASYTSWLDGLNQNHFASDNAPEFILWELSNKTGRDEFGDVDERYLLNDEPKTIYELLKDIES